MIEDSQHRIDRIRSWLPGDCLLVVAASAGKAIGILQRDRGYVYGAVMLDHDLHEQAATEDDLSLSGSDLVETLITQRLNRAGFDVTRIPYEELGKEIFNGWLEDAHYNWADTHDMPR